MTWRPELHGTEALCYRLIVVERLSDSSVGEPGDLTGATFSAATGVPRFPGLAGAVVPIDLVAGVSFPPVSDIKAPAVGGLALGDARG